MQSRWMGARLLLALAVVGGMRAATNDRCNDLLRQALENKNPDTRKQAVAALRKALEDDVPEVSFAAAKALWMLHDSAGEQALLAVLGRESKTSSNFFSKQKRDALRMIHTPRVLFLFAARTGAGFAPVPGLGQGIGSMQALLTDP